METAINNFYKTLMNSLKNEQLLVAFLTGIYSEKNVQAVVPYLKCYLSGYGNTFASNFAKTLISVELFTLRSEECINTIYLVNDIASKIQPTAVVDNIECKLIQNTECDLKILPNKLVYCELSYVILSRRLS